MGQPRGMALMVATIGQGWRLAPCLVALVRETDKLYPDRSTASDGSIGDTAHASRASDHNPADGYVCAVDITDDKANGCDADLLAQHIVASRDPRVKYVIWNRTIAKSYENRGLPPWTPQPYTGSNPHDKHTHISVHNTATVRNDTGPWWPQEENDDMPLTDADILKVAEACTKAQQRQIDDIKAKLNSVQTNLAALQRRIHGVPDMEVSAEQHKADADTGKRFQTLLGDG
jgi:hypothetical protein